MSGIVIHAILLVLVVVPARGQTAEDVPSVTRAFAIENARIVQAPGQVIERGTIVIRNGLIVDVGPDAVVPYDARRIDGDSLTVYAGFIDGLSHAGIPQPRSEEASDDDDDDVSRANPPFDKAGIQPDRSAVDLIDPSDNSVSDLRELGFTVAHVVPRDGMLPGTGALILLAGDDAEAMLIESDVALFAQIEGARRVYPATDMGVMAKMRQLYHEAERRKQIQTLYAANASGMERPPYDAVHAALFPVIDGEKRLFYFVDSPLKTYRALRLREQLGFPLVLAGLSGSFDMIPALSESGAPLFLTLDLPTPPKAAASKDSTAADSTATDATAVDSTAADSTAVLPPYDPSLRTASHEDVDAEKKNLEARQAMVRKQYYETAASLHGAGLAFGFTTKEVKASDIRKNLRTMIEHGLPEETALAALTTVPAETFGLSTRLGTIEPGKMANLVVTSGPYFDEKSTVRYVFVEGRPFENEGGSAGSGAEGEGGASPVGVWSYVIEAAGITGTITLTGTPGDLSGTFLAEGRGELDIEDAEFSGSALTFEIQEPEYGRIAVFLSMDGDSMEGTMDVPGQGSVPITATRISGPSPE